MSVKVYRYASGGGQRRWAATDNGRRVRGGLGNHFGEIILWDRRFGWKTWYTARAAFGRSPFQALERFKKAYPAPDKEAS